MVLYDTGRKPVPLGRQIARGGQGAVYSVDRQPDVLAKLYVPAPAHGQEDKLRWMAAHPPADPSAPLGHASIAWPRELLYDSGRHFLGYLMPYVQNAVPALQVFNPRSRAATAPGFDRRYLHRVGRNLAAALAALHDHNYIVGDLNESNVLVTPSALVTLIDTDSFQVQEQRQSGFFIHPSPVGKPEYTAPELQGQSFAGVVRRWEHDAFALGVLIFQLLMEGNHPFRARWLGPDDPPPLEERIRQGLFPYWSANGEPAGQKPRSGSELVTPAPGMPPLDVLHPQLAWLLRRCFLEGHDYSNRRPSAREWELALAEAERSLVECAHGHIYDAHAPACPLCGAPTPGAAQAGTGRAAQNGRTATGAGRGAPSGATTSAAGGGHAGPASGAGTRKAAGASGTTRAGSRRPGGGSAGARGSQGPQPLQQASWASALKLAAQAIAAFTTGAVPAGAATPAATPWEQVWRRPLQQLASLRQAGAPQASVGPSPAGGAAAGGTGATAGPAGAAAPAARICPRCGYANHADDLYCQRCREILTLARPCPHCGKSMPQGARYCINCSKRL